ncbi:MAG: signal peptide peptidase SppA [Myxococcota bacterium]
MARLARAMGAHGATRAIGTAPVLLLALLCSGCITIHIPIGGRAELQETVVYGSHGPKIVLIEIDGVITEADEPGFLGTGRESSVARVREQLDMARRDSEVRAILLRINSPGGTAQASELVYREVLDFKREKNVPVVAQLMGVATSGGYYVAMAADQIVAHPTTVTGSIGVIFVGVNLSGLMQKLGIQDQTFTAGAHKDAGSPLRPMRAEERTHLQSVLDDLHARFREVVALGRPKLDAAGVEKLADGRIYSASQALENGLVDVLGGIDDSIEYLQARSGLAQVRVVSYHRPQEWRRNFYTAAPRTPVIKLDLTGLLGAMPAPGFHYLWWPSGR